MNILAYEADTAWNRGIPCIFYKTLIQLYLLRSFLYSLTYCIKEVIKGKIFWRSNEKIAGLRGSYGLEQGNPLQFFQNTDPIVFVLFISLFFDLLYQRGYQRQYFWRWIEKVLAYEAATAWNRGIPCKILTFLIKLYLVLFNGSKSL